MPTPKLPPINLAFDVMGGDFGLEESVRGAVKLTLESPNLHVVLVGDEGLISPLLGRIRHSAERLSIHHAAEYISMDEPPSEALRSKPRASLPVAVQLVAQGEADAVISTGNTGACILACAQHFKLLPNIRRAALAAVYPTRSPHGPKADPFSLILDVGATVDATAEDLVSFAIMGAAYSRVISKNARPKVALLSNGTEAGKGPPRVVQAHTLLRRMDGLEFIGNIEGIDIPKGTADVVVCDGFIGNVCLKMLEGVQETVLELAHYAHKQSWVWRAGLAMLSSGIERIKQVTDWQQYGGAPILGFDRLLIKAHGRSRANAIANAGKVAAKAVAANLSQSMRFGLSP